MDFFNSLAPKPKGAAQSNSGSEKPDVPAKEKAVGEDNGESEQGELIFGCISQTNVGFEESFLKKALTRIGVSSASQLKLLDLSKKLESTYKKASVLLTNFEKDPDMNLGW